MKQHDCYSGTEECFIAYQLDKNRNSKNDNEPVLIAHKFHVKEKEKRVTVTFKKIQEIRRSGDV